MALYLLVKEHADTGLKYLCKHVASSFSECTPYGIFGSIREASQQIEGHTYKMIWNRLQNDKEWRYV